jgi:hypothetical protein
MWPQALIKDVDPLLPVQRTNMFISVVFSVAKVVTIHLITFSKNFKV